MKAEYVDNTELLGLIKDLQASTELFLKNWLDDAVILNNLETRCYIFNNCNEEKCPAYKNESIRCWLIAGTLCGGKSHVKYINKYGFCTNCDFYQHITGNDPVNNLRELIIILVHSLYIQHAAIKNVLSEMKILKGLLPICVSCNKIRDDKGYWNQIEFYISNHSEAEFTHGICPECVKKQME